MATELTPGETLARALAAHGLLKDWYELAPSMQVALDRAAADFADAATRPIADELREELREATNELDQAAQERALRKFCYFVDGDGDERFFFGDAELEGVMAWSANGKETPAKIAIVLSKDGARRAGRLLVEMEADGIDVQTAELRAVPAEKS